MSIDPPLVWLAIKKDSRPVFSMKFAIEKVLDVDGRYGFYSGGKIS